MSGRRRAALTGLLLFATVAVVPFPVHAAGADDLEDARRRAQEAAEELAEAEEKVARAGDAVAHARSRAEHLDARVAKVREQVGQLAVRLYVEGTSPLARLLRMADANEVLRTQQFTHILAGASTESLEQYRADREDLRRELANLEDERRSHAGAVENLGRRRSQAVEQVERLAAAERQANAERERRLAAERPSPDAARQPATAAPRSSPRPPTAAAPPVGGASGGWLCPVQGPRAFTNDYGAPRAGGRRHAGNDILSPRGTPVVASVGGTVTHRSGAVSGLAYYLRGDDGNEYFGAHLDSYGSSGRVSAGTVVGTVGNTGDASGGPPHLHFEIHPGGSGNVNPYPTLSRHC